MAFFSSFSKFVRFIVVFYLLQFVFLGSLLSFLGSIFLKF